MSSQEHFRETLEYIFDLLKDRILSLKKLELNPVDAEAIELVSILISKYDINALIEMFISAYDKWEMVHIRSKDFMITELPEILKGVPINVKTISFPFFVFEDLRRSAIWSERDPVEWPVNEDDLEELWEAFDSLILISCSYINNIRKDKPDYMPEISTEHYQKMFKKML